VAGRRAGAAGDDENRGGRPHGSRNRAILNEELIAALLRHFRREGERAIARMAKTQPAAYCKILTLLVPREHKVEHCNAVSGLSDEELEAAIEHIKASLAARACEQAKVIDGTVEPMYAHRANGLSGSEVSASITRWRG
jgi:hypothetical protein